MTISIDGIVPVMLTPFSASNTIDEAGLEQLVAWYLDHGAAALFAVCQSSEMQQLSLDERVFLAQRVVELVKDRVPVIASGHISEAAEDQTAELAAMASTGIAALVLVTNRIDPGNAGFAVFRTRLDTILKGLPADLPLGLYECPAPYRRLLLDDELKHCRDTGRFVVLKDVSCDLQTVERRVALTHGSPLAIVNANAAIAMDAMRVGSRGFGGVFTNFHPDLYAWLYTHKNEDSPLVRDLAVFLALAATAESMGYPKLAKIFHQRLNTFQSDHTRAVAYDIHECHWALEAVLDHIEGGTTIFRKRIAESEPGNAA